MLAEIAFNLSRGCGNPTGFSNLQRGDVVVDFGCGGGIDVILAANKVGSEGRVIGIDFSDQMIGRAKQAAVEAGLHDRDIHFHVADLEKSQLLSGCADVVLSNCVINLCPDKDAVYQEVFRILKPGGQAAISDIVITEHIASELRYKFQSAWSGCLGGAITEHNYWQAISNAGFSEVQRVARHSLTPEELQAMAACPGEDFCPPPSESDLALIEGKVASIKFTAAKPLITASYVGDQALVRATPTYNSVKSFENHSDLLAEYTVKP